MNDIVTITNITSVNPKWRRPKRIRIVDNNVHKGVRPNTSIKVSIEWAQAHIDEIVTKIEPHKMKYFHKYLVSEEDYALLQGKATKKEDPGKVEKAPPKTPPKTEPEETEDVVKIIDKKPPKEPKKTEEPEKAEEPEKKGPGAPTLKKKGPKDRILEIVGGKEAADDYLSTAKAAQMQELADIAGIEYQNKKKAREDLLEYLGLMDE